MDEAAFNTSRDIQVTTRFDKDLYSDPKEALIWSKKSTGMPITVRSAHMSKANTTPKHVSFCKLDIDIFKEMTGTELTVTVGGNWTTYRSRIVHYFQQLAIITPYAQLELSFIKDKHKEFTMRYDRRSDQMPPTAQQVQHHPLALNDLLLAQLMEHSKQRTLHGFLCHDLAAVDANLATRIVNELDTPFTLDMDIHTLTSNHIHQVVGMTFIEEMHSHSYTCVQVRLLKEMHFNVPDGHWLSPAGEYNLRLGMFT
ncbi:hypothetical protein DYB37_006417 [Aphanomyces astaci]|uniref:DNA topoisomerase VI subunit B transducer domain-containing protein n=1 Tax=Aphanomyces astaci TaxID=112090 RepID=A0A3R7ABJ1_APHAT|nr:hypothetical protein DYB37_006417 [Aphanomyces astaci]